MGLRVSVQQPSWLHRSDCNGARLGRSRMLMISFRLRVADLLSIFTQAVPREVVPWAKGHGAATVVVSTIQRRLFLGNGLAIRLGVGTAVSSIYFAEAVTGRTPHRALPAAVAVSSAIPFTLLA